MRDPVVVLSDALSVVGGDARAILDLHRPVGDSRWWWRCDGCDQGCSCDRADWPCATVRLIAEQHNIEVPESC